MNLGERKVWLVGPDTFGTLSALGRAFERLGWRPKIQAYRFIHTRAQNWFWKLAGRLGLRPRLAAKWYNQFLRKRVVPGLSTERPSLMVFLLSYQLEPDTRRALAAPRIPLVTWATDSLSRYGRFAGPWAMATHNYMFDGGDVRDGTTSWLPLGFDDEVFQPAEDRFWDVLFVGRVFAVNYTRRLRFLERLADSDLPCTRRVALAGTVVRQHRRVEQRFRERGGVCLGELPAPQLARAIAAAKIAVSIHQDDGHQPVNPMFFAIPGCRTCLVTDRRDYLSRWLRPEEEFVPADLENFADRLAGLLRQDAARAQLAERGYRAALQHTWIERVRAVLLQLPLTQSGAGTSPAYSL